MQNATFPQMLDINLSFFLRTGYKYKNRQHPIVLRISYRKKRKDILTGYSCPKDNWSPEANRVRVSYKEGEKINEQLVSILHQVKDIFDSMKYSKKYFTVDDLVEKLKGNEAAPQTLNEYMDLKMEELKERIGIDLSKPTFYKYRRTKLYMDEFLLVKKHLRNIPISDVNPEFINQFFQFLRKQKNNNHNSALALLNCLKTILKMAVKTGVIVYNPFAEFKLNQKPVYRDFLTMEEIEKLQKLKNLTKSLELKRDLFLFACFTGLAYADLYSLNIRDIIIDGDGTKHLLKNRQKTNVISMIPLLPSAENILSKYSPTADFRDFIWKIPCNQKLNAGLKEIAGKAGISKKLFMHLGRHTFASTVTLSNGIPLETVSKMLGHSTIKHTQLYAKIVAYKVKSDMNKIMEIFK